MRALLVALLLAPLPLASADVDDEVVVFALAVAQTRDGLVGSVANVRIHQEPGTGLVLLDTQPFAQVDLQGSARLAVRVAGEIAGIDTSERDFRIVVRSQTSLIGGPSAGGIMTVGAIAALRGWETAPDAYMTGTISPDGAIGPVGGVPEKAEAAARRGARLFLYPAGEEEVTTFTPQGRVRVNMSDRCEALRIECRAVLDVYDALPLLTGYTLERPPLPDPFQLSRYQDALLPLAGIEIDEVSTSIATLEARLNTTPAATHPSIAAAQRQRDLAHDALQEARKALSDRQPYTATSRAFLAQIHVRQASLTLDLLEATDSSDALDARLDELSDASRAALRAAQAAGASTPSRFEAAAAAQQRALQAQESATLASQALRRRDTNTALFQLAYGAERAQTVYWWLNTTDLFPSEQNVEPEQRALAAIAGASEHLAYATATLEGAGATTLLNAADARLSRARASYEAHLPAAATYDALEAQVRASLALETLAYGEDAPQARIERARSEAERAIARARAQGIEPLLAATQLENGDSLEGTDRLAAYDLARLIAASHAQGSPTLAAATRASWTLTPLGWAGLYVGIGIILGGAVTGTFLSARQQAATRQAAHASAQEPASVPIREERAPPPMVRSVDPEPIAEVSPPSK